MFSFLYNPIFGFFSSFFSTHINGMTSGCTGMDSMSIANIVGTVMILSTLAAFIILYYLLDKPKYHKKHWVWLFAISVMTLNGIIAFFLVYRDIVSGDYCSLNPIQLSDGFGFALLNAIWSFLIFAILSFSPLRKMSKHLSSTTLLKP